MKFLDIVDKHLSLLTEQDPGTTAADATTPDPSAATAAAGNPQQIQVLPPGYADLVKLLVQATAMSFPPGALDKLYTTKVTEANAGDVRDAIKSAMKSYENDENNLQNLDNTHYKEFLNSINPSNFYEKLKKVANIVDPDHKILPREHYV